MPNATMKYPTPAPTTSSTQGMQDCLVLSCPACPVFSCLVLIKFRFITQAITTAAVPTTTMKTPTPAPTASSTQGMNDWIVYFCLAYKYLPHIVLSCFSFLYFLQSIRTLFCLVQSCVVLPCRILSCFVLAWIVLSCLDLSCIVLNCFVLSCLVLSCLVV